MEQFAPHTVMEQLNLHTAMKQFNLHTAMEQSIQHLVMEQFGPHTVMKQFSPHGHGIACSGGRRHGGYVVFSKEKEQIDTRESKFEDNNKNTKSIPLKKASFLRRSPPGRSPFTITPQCGRRIER